MNEIKIHLIHGSTRKNAQSRKSNRLFGLLGGHVLIQVDEQLYSFSYRDRMNRIWPRKVNKNGQFKIEHYPEWIEEVSWEKRTTYTASINDLQYQKLMDVIHGFKKEVPFDYALFGERCCSVHYRILSAAEVIKTSRRLKLLSAIPMFYIHLLERFFLSPIVSVEKVKGCTTRIWI